MKALQLLLALLIVSTTLSGCLRGENSSVEQVLKLQQDRFNDSWESAQELPKDVSASLMQLQTKLSQLATAKKREGMPQAAQQVSDTLFDLLPRAGVPTRPALSEIITQYQVLGTSAAATNMSFATLQLLVARTFSVLSAELETTAFRVVG